MLNIFSQYSIHYTILLFFSIYLYCTSKRNCEYIQLIIFIKTISHLIIIVETDHFVLIRVLYVISSMMFYRYDKLFCMTTICIETTRIYLFNYIFAAVNVI